MKIERRNAALTKKEESKHEPMEAIIIKFRKFAKRRRRKWNGKKGGGQIRKGEKQEKGIRKKRAGKKDAKQAMCSRKREENTAQNSRGSADQNINRPDIDLPSCFCPCLSCGTSPSLVEHRHCCHRCRDLRTRPQTCGSSATQLAGDVEVWLRRAQFH